MKKENCALKLVDEIILKVSQLMLFVDTRLFMLTYTICIITLYQQNFDLINVTANAVIKRDLKVLPVRQEVRNYRGADKPLARPISRCILFDG